MLDKRNKRKVFLDLKGRKADEEKVPMVGVDVNLQQCTDTNSL
jgi:hypothetical protein